MPGEMLIQFEPGSDARKVLQAYAAIGSQPSGLEIGDLLSPPMNIYQVYFDENFSAPESLMELLRRDHSVSLAQFNHYVHPRDTIIPNDPEFEDQWHHLNTGQTGGTPGADIGSTKAWDITTGGLTATGDTIVVCVIEGGNLNHPDLADNAWVNHGEIPGNGIDDDENGYVDDYLGWNVNTQSDSPVLQGNHGTQVMGMIGATGNNELGVTGINWNVKIMSVAGQSLNNEASVVAAYAYPLTQRKLYNETNGDRGAFVVATNASWGIDGGSMDDVPIWKAYYDTLGAYGILNCGATANNNVDIDIVDDIPTGAPSDYMVSVTATNHNDIRTFSAYGATTIDLAAPGASVMTTSGSQGYGTTSGTSFASPLTAGVIALLYSIPCESFMDLVKGNPQLGADYVRYALLEGVDPVESLQGMIITGGRVNAYNSLKILEDNCAAEDLCLPPFSFNFSLSDDTLYSFTWNAIDTNGVSIRYRIEDEEEWTVLDSIASSPFVFVPEEFCANYEFEIASTCSYNDSTETYLWGSKRSFESKGCCVAPGNFEVNLLDSTSIETFWSSTFNLDAYEVFYREEGSSEWISAGVFEDEEALIEDLEVCTFYEILVRPLCAEDFDESALSDIIRTKGCGHCIDSPYCEAGGENSFWEYIQSVEIGPYVFNSGNDGGYAFFEDTGIELEVLGEYETTLSPGFTFGTYNQYFRLWIDLNQDGEFSEDELLMSSESGSSQAITDTVHIPETALLGSTRMRVSMKFVGNSSAVVEECEVFNEGETEDYCLTIVESTLSTSTTDMSAGFRLFPNPNTGQFRVQVLEPSAGSNYVLHIFDLSGKKIEAIPLNGSETGINLNKLGNGMYMYSVANERGEFVHHDRFVIAR